MINMIQNAKDQAAQLAMTAYRAAVADGRSLDGMVPPAVAAYIEEHRLYRAH